MADPVFIARLVAASLVAVVLLAGAGNGVNGASAPHSRGAGQTLASK
jgi:hypothetical protein